MMRARATAYRKMCDRGKCLRQPTQLPPEPQRRFGRPILRPFARGRSADAPSVDQPRWAGPPRRRPDNTATSPTRTDRQRLHRRGDRGLALGSPRLSVLAALPRGWRQLAHVVRRARLRDPLQDGARARYGFHSGPARIRRNPMRDAAGRLRVRRSRDLGKFSALALMT